jgi:peroxiredoxin
LINSIAQEPSMTFPRPLDPGAPAPTFELPAVHREGTLSLDDYRGRSALMLGFFRGLFCPFCRRQIAQLGAASARLQDCGVECMGIVITPVGRGRMYFRYRPSGIALAADEAAATHRLFGVPRIEMVTENGVDAVWPHQATPTALDALRVNPYSLFPEPVSVREGGEILNQRDGFNMTAEDSHVMENHWNQLDGLFLIDRNGVVQWRYLEAAEDPTQLGSFPSESELLEVAELARS